MIYIDDIPSFRAPESFELEFDDRIEKIKLIKGNTIQDYGFIQNGETFLITCIFSQENYLRLTDLWIRRQKVTLTDEGGFIYENLRLVFRKVQYLSKFPRYVILTFELWKV